MPGRTIHNCAAPRNDDSVIDSDIAPTLLTTSPVLEAALIAVTLAALLFMDLPAIRAIADRPHGGVE